MARRRIGAKLANGEIINDVKEALKKPEAISTKTAQIMTLSLVSDLHDKLQEVKQRTDEMWPFYRWGRWGAVLIIGLGITDIVTRVLTAAAASK